MPINTAIIPSYTLQGAKGRQIARLKGMDRGWFYPTFIINFIENPAALLMYDKFYYDTQAIQNAFKFILYKAKINIIDDDALTEILNSENPQIDKLLDSPNEILRQQLSHKINLLSNLFSSPLFESINIEKLLKEKDVNNISEQYYSDIQNNRYNTLVSELVTEYGSDYARPSPYAFEAMNINVIGALSAKLNASILDDYIRTSLYQYKIESSFDDIHKAELYLESFSQSIVGIPSFQIQDVHQFLDYHQSKHLTDFRNHIYGAASSGLNKEQIVKELIDANKSLNFVKKPTYLSIFGLLLRTVGSTASLGLSLASSNPYGIFASGCGFCSSIMASKSTLEEYWTYKDLDWFRFLRGVS